MTVAFPVGPQPSVRIINLKKKSNESVRDEKFNFLFKINMHFKMKSDPFIMSTISEFFRPVIKKQDFDLTWPTMT